MRLSWFAPLPPAPSEIASFTAHLLPHFQGRADVTVYTDQQPSPRRPQGPFRVRPFRSAADIPNQELAEADAVIYHLGNNLLHAESWQVSRRFPGIVVLHDYRLQHMFAALFFADNIGAEYFRQMGRLYGPLGVQAADRYRRGGHSTESMAEQFPLTELAVENALAVLVHSVDNFELLRLKDRWPVAYAPLPFVAEEAGTATGARPSGPPYRLIVFGYLTPGRRLEQVLRALAALPEKDRFRLDIFGKPYDEPLLRSWIQADRLEGMVTLHGFVPSAVLERALAGAHLAINLRYPTMGEASASQLRIWSHGLPSLVSSVDWFATLPADTVVFVRPGREVEDVQAALRAFLQDPARFAAMGQRGRRVLEERHSPAGYVEAILELAAGVRRWQGAALARRLGDRAAAEASAWLGPNTSPAWTRRLATTIHELTLGEAEVPNVPITRAA